jgi:4-amino-4-deoxy-L-arabinose transferase-like glycosyltransferase
LAVIYSLVTPPFEAGDESRHYAVVKYMADTGRLPVQEPGEAQIHWSHEGNQPPLYYALAAALTFWVDTGTWDDVFWYNPHTTIGNPLRADNKNITIHPPTEAWPWRGYALAVHLARFLSIAMAAVTVTAAYFIALRLFKGNQMLAAGAMAITAFNPMFIFISASVNNDNAVIMFTTLVLWLMVRMGNFQFSMLNSQLKNAALLGLLIGLGALSKLYGLGLLPLGALLLAWLMNDQRPTTNAQSPISNLQSLISNSAFWRRFILLTLTMTLTAAAVAGWFYVRNALLYQGDFLALQAMRDTAGMRDSAPTLATLRAEFQGFRIAYWALFGGVNVLADDWIYPVLDWVSLIAVIGVIAFILQFTIYDLRFTTIVPEAKRSGIYDLRFTKHATRNTHTANYKSQFAVPNTYPISLPTFFLLLGWYLIMVAGFIVWNITQPAGQGRLMYPAIAAISTLAMLGLTWWLPRRGHPWLVGLVALGLFAFAAMSPFRYIAPAYAHPPLLTPADLPADMQRLDHTYNSEIRLIGYRLHTQTVRPAQTLPLTLYWELLQPVKTNYSVFVHLLGRQRQVVGQFDTYPGGGAWPTTLLKPGQIVADTYAVPVNPQAELGQAPARLLIAAGIYNYREPGRPGKPAVNAAGQPVGPIIAAAKLAPWQWPAAPASASPVNFFDKTTLLAYELAPSQLTLTWQVNQPFEADTTVFIQAWRADTRQYAAGFDGPPVLGDYPTTLWAPGEIIVDAHPLELNAQPPGRYYFLVGLYNPATGERLPAFGPNGPLPDYAVNVGEITVPPPDLDE